MRRKDYTSAFGCIVLAIWLLIAGGVITFWVLVIYVLYLLATGQLHTG